MNGWMDGWNYAVCVDAVVTCNKKKHEQNIKRKEEINFVCFQLPSSYFLRFNLFLKIPFELEYV